MTSLSIPLMVFVKFLFKYLRNELVFIQYTVLFFKSFILVEYTELYILVIIFEYIVTKKYLLLFSFLPE